MNLNKEVEKNLFGRQLGPSFLSRTFLQNQQLTDDDNDLTHK